MTLGDKKHSMTKMLFQLLPMFTSLQEWEKDGLDHEIALHEGSAPGAKHVRMNCTVPWRNKHWAGCPVHAGGHGTQPNPWASWEESPSASAGAAASTVSVSAGAAARTHGTQPVVTGAVRVPALKLTAASRNSRRVNATRRESRWC